MPSAQPSSSTAPAEAPAAPLQSAPQPAAVTPAPTSGAPPPWTRWSTGPFYASTHSSPSCRPALLLVETYLQNLKLDQQMGPAPREDHYFFGRLDLSDSVDRQDYLSKDTSFQNRMMGGVTKLFKFEYKPIGFSWMIFADRDDFDRAHYDFKYVHREFQGDVRCIVFDVTPKERCRQRPLPGPHLGGRPGFQHRQAQRYVCASSPKCPVLPHGQLAPESDSGLLGPDLHLQRRRRFQLRLERQTGLQGADPDLGLRPEKEQQGRRAHPGAGGFERKRRKSHRAGCLPAAGPARMAAAG